MFLKDELVKTGNWLFKWRSYLPVLFILIICFSFNHISYFLNSPAWTYIWEFCCIIISLLGFFVRCYTIGYTPPRTSGRNTKHQVAQTLNTTGMYSITRNPLYLGNFLMMLGITLFLHIWWIVALYIFLFWLYYERIIAAEEEFLHQKFQETYLEYVKRVPIFIPNFRLWQPPDRPFSWKKVLRQEYSGLFAMVFTFGILDIIEDSVNEKRLIIDIEVIIFVAVGFFVYVILRTLKKRRILSEQSES